MAFNDTFRISSHGVIFNDVGQVLLLKATYGKCSWGLPGGALEPGETIHQALLRECQEELGVSVKIEYLSGVYYHSAFNSQACIFKAQLGQQPIHLSAEHSEYAYFDIDSLSDIQKQRVQECVLFNGNVVSDSF
ncbi:NUDIX domain-containing protein [Paraglaciecola sp. 20A4]|uniref:NUDIX hydrolase n=1 Tax=Paraglaciecola sp. 20A4 TaxID=2687288 RepID=UPI00140B4B03|nr:NUDIX domain-containing protein [Paraglaciecola sp. 20A4]